MMSFVSALWLLLLHAAYGATALPARDSVRDRVLAAPHATVVDLGTRVASSPASLPEQTVRAPLGAAVTLLAKLERILPHGGLSELPLDGRRVRPSIASATRRVLRQAGHEAHRLASRGSHLPYFATAPPPHV